MPCLYVDFVVKKLHSLTSKHQMKVFTSTKHSIWATLQLFNTLPCLKATRSVITIFFMTYAKIQSGLFSCE